MSPPRDQDPHEDEVWYAAPEDDGAICIYCNGTGLSDKWDEESYCERCNGMGYTDWDT